MGDYGHVVSWGGTRTGRERKALEVWADALELYEKAVANSKIESYDTLFFEPSGGAGPSGMTICWGTQEQIDAWARDDDRMRVEIDAALVVENMAVTRCIRGQAVAEGFGRYMNAVNSL